MCTAYVSTFIFKKSTADFTGFLDLSKICMQKLSFPQPHFYIHRLDFYIQICIHRKIPIEVGNITT